jgi:hypothetical protein
MIRLWIQNSDVAEMGVYGSNDFKQLQPTTKYPNDLLMFQQTKKKSKSKLIPAKIFK